MMGNDDRDEWRDDASLIVIPAAIRGTDTRSVRIGTTARRTAATRGFFRVRGSRRRRRFVRSFVRSEDVRRGSSSSSSFHPLSSIYYYSIERWRKLKSKRHSYIMPTQCLSTAVVGAAFCAKRCSSDALARDLAFFPPEPPSYTIVETASVVDAGWERRRRGDESEDETRRTTVQTTTVPPTTTRLRALSNVDHVPVSHARAFQKVLDDFRVDLVQTSRGNDVAVFACEPPASRISSSDADEDRAVRQTADVTMVFSHGNAVDAGEVAPFARKLAQQLNCRVVAYDYSGYGQSRGDASVADTHADIAAVVEHVMKTYDITRREIIMLGQSIGSGPTCQFASRRENADLGAVVLVSPLMSALNVVSNPEAWCTPAKVFKKMDVYKNYQVVKTIQCPILLVHGDQDDVVHVSHGEALWGAIRKNAKTSNLVFEPYWIRGAGHDDTYDRNPAEYIRRLRGVCAVVRERFVRDAVSSRDASPPATTKRDDTRRSKLDLEK